MHLARIFGLCVEKTAELFKNDPRRKFKHRVVFGGNNVVTQSWEGAVFQDIGSSPATMTGSKFVDFHGMLPGHDVQQADAEQAYLLSDFEGEETWVALPNEAWPSHWICKYTNPVVRLEKALYGHPDSGGYWEKHCDKVLRKVGLKALEDWPPLYLF